jgi:hypothetical protein
MTKRKAGHISPFIYESLEYFLQKYFNDSRVGYLSFSMWLYGFGQSPKIDRLAGRGARSETDG